MEQNKVEDSQIAQWKSKYGTVLRTKVQERMVYYRQLTAGEYEELMAIEERVDGSYVEDKVISRCVLSPVDICDIIGKESVGISQLSNVILKSSVVTDEELVSQARESRARTEKNLFRRIIAGIITHIPAYTPEDLMGKNIDQLIDLVALAELVPVQAGVTESKIIIDPEEKKNKKIPQGAPPPGNIPNVPLQNQKKSIYSTEDLQTAAMTDSMSALAKEMEKHGKRYPTIEEKLNQKQPQTLAEKIRDQQKKLKDL